MPTYLCLLCTDPSLAPCLRSLVIGRWVAAGGEALSLGNLPGAGKIAGERWQETTAENQRRLGSGALARDFSVPLTMESAEVLSYTYISLKRCIEGACE